MRRHKLNKKIAEIQELNAHTNEIMGVANIERQATKNAKKAAAALKKAEVARAKAEVRDTPLIRLQRNATRNIQLIREEMEALKINKRVNKALKKANAAATRTNIIRRI
jgi:predicted transglutaminase-like cysteine proteinase